MGIIIAAVVVVVLLAVVAAAGGAYFLFFRHQGASNTTSANPTSQATATSATSSTPSSAEAPAATSSAPSETAAASSTASVPNPAPAPGPPPTTTEQSPANELSNQSTTEEPAPAANPSPAPIHQRQPPRRAQTSDEGYSRPRHETQVQPATASPTNEIADITALDQKPVQLDQLQFNYTPDAIAQHLTGTIVLDLIIDPTGRVSKVSFVQGPTPDYGMDTICEGSAMALRFSPPMLHGAPVSTRMLLPVVLNPPPPPKTKPKTAGIGVVLQAKTDVQRFEVQVDGQPIWDTTLIRTGGGVDKTSKELRVPVGNHQLLFLAWTKGASEPTRAEWSYTYSAGEHHVFLAYVNFFGNLKLSSIQ
ncbi:MAG: hypothetical protein ACP5VF_10185 [Acidobacteriota bacterium]